MHCPTCKADSVEVTRNVMEHATIRVNQCLCEGVFVSVEVSEDRWKLILSEAGRMYGMVKSLVVREEEETDG